MKDWTTRERRAMARAAVRYFVAAVTGAPAGDESASAVVVFTAAHLTETAGLDLAFHFCLL